ncbi:hypothetical protein [Agromyces arachidis]|uniref:hypothetical protein n=1 Tax=Agromyces arachidis TaxID=766966 RepID=UPI004056082A
MRITALGRFVYAAQWIAAILLIVFIVIGRVLVGSSAGFFMFAGWIYGLPALLILLLPPLITRYDQRARTTRCVGPAYAASSLVLWAALLIVGLALPDGGFGNVEQESALSAWTGLRLNGSFAVLNWAILVAFAAWIAQLVIALASSNTARRETTAEAGGIAAGQQEDGMPSGDGSEGVQRSELKIDGDLATGSGRQVDGPAGDPGRAWLLGGWLLVGAAVADLLAATLLPALGVIVVGPVLFGVALLVFANGIRGAGSITRRQPLGTWALILLAAWSIAGPLAWRLFPVSALTEEQLQLLAGIDTLIGLTLAVIASIEVARARIVPSPWNWAPMWALAAVFVVSLAMILAAFGGMSSSERVPLLAALTQPVGPVLWAATAFLGVTAIVLTLRHGAHSSTRGDEAQSTLTP